MQTYPEHAQIAKLKLLQQLRTIDCVSTLVLVASRVAHDIGTPLAVIAGRSGMIARGELVGDGAKRSAAIIAEQTERISAVLRQLLDVTRWHASAGAATPIGDIVTEACVMLSPIAAERNLSLNPGTSGPGAALCVRAGSDCAMQIVTHLLAHAMAVAKPGTAIDVTIDAIEIPASADPRVPGGAHARVTVAHQPGQAAAEYSLRNFDLFAAAQAGGYFGLAICDAVVRAQGGRVSCERVSEGAAQCAFHLPALG